MPKLCRLFDVGEIDQPRGAHPWVSAQFRHRGWLSKIGVLFFSPTHFKKKDKIEKEGLKKRNREKINTKVGQPIWMLKLFSNCSLFYSSILRTIVLLIAVAP